MKKRSNALIFAALIGLIIVAIGLGFLMGVGNPIPWILIAVLLLIPFAYKKYHKPSLIFWKEEYSVGVKSLDDDHKRLIFLLNQFKTAYDYDTSADFERQALEQLVEYTRFHFTREEDMMQQAGYSDIENHKNQHIKMIAQVEDFVDQYRREGHDSLNEVSVFLSDWLIRHINGTDKQYTQCMLEKGLS
ncbi:MAG: bacteriohemerythrin [Oleispira antarctica]|nr:bacteriohemerythrin [Oleispira antarctica]MBQ0792519.1 bacteriohemerythrin [Oleispira antarctica]